MNRTMVAATVTIVVLVVATIVSLCLTAGPWWGTAICSAGVAGNGCYAWWLIWRDRST